MMSLRVLQVVESQSRDAGSVFISVSGLIQRLRAENIEAPVISTDRGADDPKARADALREAVQRADVIHIHGWEHVAAHIAAESATAQNKPFVLSPLCAFSEHPNARAGWMARWRLGRRDRKRLRACRRLLTIHRREAADCRGRWPGLTTEILPYGLDTDAYASIARSRGDDFDTTPRWMLVLAPLHPAEGCVLLLKSLAELGRAASDWSVILAGQDAGTYRRMLEAALRRKGAHDRVRFETPDDEEAQRQLLGRADVLVSPVLRGCRPVSILQGLAAGVPSLASDLVVPDELTEGLVTCAPTRAGFREAIAAILSMSAARRKQMSDRARTLAKQRIDWQVLAPRYAALYREVAQG